MRGVTRGDGTTGEEVTANVRTIRSIPLRVDAAELKKLRMPLDFEVRGEIIMPLRAFEALNEKQEEEGGKRFSNPRNAAAGAVRVLDPEITRSRQLDFYGYLFAGGRARSDAAAFGSARSDAEASFQGFSGLARVPFARRGEKIHRFLGRQAREIAVRNRRHRDQGERNRAAAGTGIHVEGPALGRGLQISGAAGNDGRERCHLSGGPHGHAHAGRGARAGAGRRRHRQPLDAAQHGRNRAAGAAHRRHRDRRARRAK